MKKGDIVRADNREKHPHPIVFLEQKSNGDFEACIITHERGKGNIKMEENHFHKVDENGELYPIQYEDSYLIYDRLSKEYNWITNEVVKGKLTEAGIKYVESNIPQKARWHNKPIWE